MVTTIARNFATFLIQIGTDIANDCHQSRGYIQDKRALLGQLESRLNAYHRHELGVNSLSMTQGLTLYFEPEALDLLIQNCDNQYDFGQVLQDTGLALKSASPDSKVSLRMISRSLCDTAYTYCTKIGRRYTRDLYRKHSTRDIYPVEQIIAEDIDLYTELVCIGLIVRSGTQTPRWNSILLYSNQQHRG